MIKFLTVFFLTVFILFFAPLTFAADNTFISIVNPVRGFEFWDKTEQMPQTAVEGQIEILKKFHLPATWLLRFDALDDKKIIDDLNKISDEKGLFLEITPTITKAAGVEYRKGESWHDAKSAFLTGYESGEREKLIDASFEKFKKIFGYYPASVGAWWIDAYSLDYMQKKYAVIAAMIVSDQYTTDNYQIWGQYFSTPYYPSRQNALHPAQTLEHKLPLLMMQWAPRDPVNSYGNGVFESTFSVQANDYIDYHNLDTNYFSRLLDIYGHQKFNKFSQLVVGLENSYSWEKYSKAYENQLKIVSDRKNSGQLSVLTMKDFASWYKQNFPGLSPPQIIVADDPLGSSKKVVWFMNPYYRVGWFYNSDGSIFRDIRQYIDSEEELCFQKRCDSVNFATSATRVLDEVTFGHQWVIDQGKIKDFKVMGEGEKYILKYENEAGKKREIEFLPRDIGVDGKILSIDSAILNATKSDLQPKNNYQFIGGGFRFSSTAVILKTLKFMLFLILAVLPGFILISKAVDKSVGFLQRIFLSAVASLTVLTLLFYLLSLLNIRPVIYGYFLVSTLVFFKYFFKKLKENISLRTVDLSGFIILLLVISGTIFQITPTFRSGLEFSYGLGFWGPNTHDGVWHLALINQLLKNVPPENPIFSGQILKNYHFFYDLLITGTTYLTNIPVTDLIFRFYPIIFSLLLGTGTYFLMQSLFKDRFSKSNLNIATAFSLYFVYFAGSFGWIVEYLRERHLGGESAFWANQSISFNLNPPFAISLIMVIAILQLLPMCSKNKKLLIFILATLSGSLISFKAYGGILILLTILVVGILKKSVPQLLVFVASLVISAFLFISNFSLGQKLVAFSPFWFIHSMIDSPDRVGWLRLSLSRNAGLTQGNWFKFLGVEALSLFIFIAGNLGTRVLALFSLLNLKVIFKENKYLFLFIFSGLSLVIPILFIQGGNPWNTIQFSYYGLYMAAFISGVVLAKLQFILPKLIFGLVIGAVLLLTPINSVTTASYYLGFLPHARIDSKELAGLKFLAQQPDDTVLTYPYDKKLKNKIAEPWQIYVYDSTAYVSALSKKAVYLEDEPQNEILFTDYRKRLVASKDFFQRPDTHFLTDNHIRYIYLPKGVNIRLDENSLSIKNIFENEEVIIYQTIQ